MAVNETSLQHQILSKPGAAVVTMPPAGELSQLQGLTTLTPGTGGGGGGCLSFYLSILGGADQASAFASAMRLKCRLLVLQ